MPKTCDKTMIQLCLYQSLFRFSNQDSQYSKAQVIPGIGSLNFRVGKFPSFNSMGVQVNPTVKKGSTLKVGLG